MMAIKGRNAVIIAPSPLGYRTTALAVDYMPNELAHIGLPRTWCKILPSPVTKDTTQALMEAVNIGADESNVLAFNSKSATVPAMK